MEKNLMGVFAPITTPFNADESVDYDGLKRNMEIYSKSGIKGYLALGSNGENKSLTNEEKLEVSKIIIENKAKDQTVTTGCIFESTKETIEFAKKLESIGTDYLTLLPPSYFKKYMTDDALFEYFTDVADAVNIPCLVYNAPQFCANTVLSVNLLNRITKHPRLVGVKDSSSNNIESYLLSCRDSMNIMAGSANFFMRSIIMGGVGGIVSLANIFPTLIVELYELILNREYEHAYEINEKILRLNCGISGNGGVAAVKYAMDLVGLVGGIPRKPLLPLIQQKKEAVKNVLLDANMI